MQPRPHKSPRIRRLSSAGREFSALGLQEELGRAATLRHRRACLEEGSGGSGFTAPGPHSTPRVQPRWSCGFPACLTQAVPGQRPEFWGTGLPKSPAACGAGAVSFATGTCSTEVWGLVTGGLWGGKAETMAGLPISSAPTPPTLCTWSPASVYPSGMRAVVRLLST